MSRRRFLKSASGMVAVSVLGVPALANSRGTGQVGTDGSSIPGIASQRIDGFAKVAGKKVYARDFYARDMGAPWPKTQKYAMYLRALHTDQRFVGLTNLPPAARSARLVYGDMLDRSLLNPNIPIDRDLHMDERIRESLSSGPSDSSFDHPDAVLFDLIVQPGKVPDFLGQAVALLVFDDVASYREAKRAMQFKDADFQVYAAPDGPLPPLRKPFQPETTYVKFNAEGENFSYAAFDDDKRYMAEVEKVRHQIENRLSSMPDLIKHNFTCDMQAMDPMFMEPEAGLAFHHVTSTEKTLHLVLGTQSPDHDVDSILSMFNDSEDAPYKLDAVTLTSCYPGGGFGGRDKSPFSLMLGLASAFSYDEDAEGQKTYVPLRLEYDRFEQFRVGLKRHAATGTGQIALTPDMNLQNIEMTLDFDGGGRKNLSPYVANLAGLCAGGAYTCDMANIYAQAYHSGNISGGSQRGFGGPQAFFAIETALDDVARELDWDPIQLRLANVIREGDTTVVGGPMDQELRLTEMLEIAEAHPLWADRELIKLGFAEEGKVYGTGLAMSLQAYGTSGDGMVAAVHMAADGTLSVESDAVDMGNGSATTLGVVIGDILGANAQSVDMGCYTLFGQTGLQTNSNSTERWADPTWTAKGVGSSSACLTALHQVHVVQQTARALFELSILPAARDLWGLPDLTADDVMWNNGLLVLETTEADPIPLADLAYFIHENGLPTGTLGHAYFQGSWAEADYALPTGTIRLQLDSLATYGTGGSPRQLSRLNTTGPDAHSARYSRTVWAPCVNVVGVTVDTTNGHVQIENVLSVLNAGRVHVPELVSGQSQGGVAMAISYTLLEDMPPGMEGPADGTWNLNRYHVAHAMDVPLNTRFDPLGRAQELIVLPESEGDKKSGRGIAEAVMCSISPAISNALKDAVGVRYTSLPITPHKILKGLSK
ncbi:xanthine dehydrogenase family protein molybdopterin-binding subunit [Actibacterium pelagium]|nr:molybdopterin cofactor-binding domain-containing protein [Actibacterium pelagium]